MIEQEFDNRIKLQNAEFDALEKLIKAYDTLCKVPVVDNDYPEVRHYYESALRNFIDALKANRTL